MKHDYKPVRSMTAALLVLAGSCLLNPTQDVYAAPDVVPVPGVSYNVNTSLANNLRLLRGKRINVTLDSGKIMAGVVKDVGDKLLHLEQIEGREYFDALIRLDSINSVDTRFRSFKR